MPISARTFGPYRFTRAACRPSLSRSISSLRSSCFVLVSSRIAETTSVAFAISVLSPQSSVFSVAGQASITDVVETVRARGTALRRENYGLLIGHCHDPGTYTTQSSDLHLHIPAHELHPVAVPAHGPLNPPARHFQHIAITQGTARIQPLLERSADAAAVFDRDVPWRTVNADLDERPVRRTADAQVGQIEPQRLQPGPKGLDKTLSEHGKKSAGRTSPASGGECSRGLPHVNRALGRGRRPSVRPARARRDARRTGHALRRCTRGRPLSRRCPDCAPAEPGSRGGPAAPSRLIQNVRQLQNLLHNSCHKYLRRNALQYRSLSRSRATSGALRIARGCRQPFRAIPRGRERSRPSAGR